MIKAWQARGISLACSLVVPPLRLIWGGQEAFHLGESEGALSHPREGLLFEPSHAASHWGIPQRDTAMLRCARHYRVEISFL